MVHALDEIRRVLVPDGILIDLRPIMDRWPVEVASARAVVETGRLHDSLEGLEEDAAANRAIAQAEQNNWFQREMEQFFPYYYSWDTPSEMEEWANEEWHDFLDLDEELRQATRSAWALGDGDARVRVQLKMLIARCRKQNSTESES
jgi:hypothetical protein